MWGKSAFLGVCLMGLSSAAMADNPRPFGKGFDNWSFTQQTEKPGVVNCRAHHRVGGRDDILAARTKGPAYLSVRADDRKGKYKDSIILPLREPETGMQWTLLAEANGKRLWFIMPANAIEMIADRGGYTYLLGGTEDRDDVNLGKSAAAAWRRVKECVVANGG
jgi:hypothetical protein